MKRCTHKVSLNSIFDQITPHGGVCTVEHFPSLLIENQEPRILAYNVLHNLLVSDLMHIFSLLLSMIIPIISVITTLCYDQI